MLVVKTIAKIRRAYLQDKKPIKQTCQELRVSRNTVRRVIRSGATEFTYERSVQPQPKIGAWKDALDRMLAENARKPKRDRLTASPGPRHIPIRRCATGRPGRCSRRSGRASCPMPGGSNAARQAIA